MLRYSVSITALMSLLIAAPIAFAQPMSGIYDVGGGANNYPDLVSAGQALTTNGLGGAVNFNVYPGTYTGQISLGVITGSSAANTIIFHGIPGPTGQRPVVTNAGDDAFYLTGTSYVTIENFEFTGCGGYGGIYTYYSGGDSSHHIIIKDNYFHSQAVSYNQYSYRCHHITLCNNEVSGGSYGLRVRYCPNTEAYNNMIYGTTTAGLYTHNTANSHYSYNSIYDESNYTLRYGSGNEGGTCRNNIAYNYDVTASYGCVFYQSAPSIHDYNNFYAPNGAPIARYLSTSCATLTALQSASGQEANSISVDPGFLSATDLHISDTSACIAAGTPIASIGEDFDGDFRDPVIPCIGCDELGGSGLILAMTPVNPPIQIPASGGAFRYDAIIENTTQNTYTFDAWTKVVLPSGAVYGPIILRTGLSITPGQTMGRTNVGQTVPGSAPSGYYAYIGNLGIYPGTVFDNEEFGFRKLAGDASASGYEQDWTCNGFFGDEFSASSAPSEYTLFEPSPNPFNPSTNLSFYLPEAGDVSLKVFDTLGREVILLAEGWYPSGTHETVFNGTRLTSGIYFAVFETTGVKATKKLMMVK